MSTISAMLESASRYPIPSRAEQLHLGTLIQRGLQPDATPREKRAGERARRRLVEGNIRLAISVAKSFTRRIQGRSAMGLEDLIQESVIGLNTAALKFDPTRGYSFTTMATWWCRQATARSVQVQADTIRLPIHQAEVVRRWRYRPVGQDLASFCSQWSYIPERVREVLRLAHQATVRGLDGPAGVEDGASLLDLIADPDSEPSTEGLDLELAVARMEAALPEDLELVQASLSTTVKALAEGRGVTRNAMATRVAAARRKLAAVAGPGARALLEAA